MGKGGIDMSCEEARRLLDAYVDGELSPEQERGLMDHVNACENCKQEYDAACTLRDMLGDMDDNIAVPLEAQAAWRSAVRAEAKKKISRRWTRIASSVAAALVLVFGLTMALRPGEEAPAGMPMTINAPIIARDGESEQVSAAADGAEQDYSAWKKYSTERFDAACETIEALTAEYSGSFKLEGEPVSGAREAVYRIELPRDYMADFLSAASCIGSELDSETMDAAGETAVIYIQIGELKAE